MRISSVGAIIAVAAILLLALPAPGSAGQPGKEGVDVEKALNPIGLSTETMKAEQFKEENKAKVSTDFFEGIRDIWIGLIHPAKFGADVARMPKSQ